MPTQTRLKQLTGTFGHHVDTVSQVESGKTVNGKKLIITLGIGFLLFTIVMGFGTYGLAKLITPMLERHNAQAHLSKPAR